jgi:hypothetical protein
VKLARFIAAARQEDNAVMQPLDCGQVFEPIPCSKNYHRLRYIGEGKKVDFVFGDEDLGNRELQPGKGCLCHRDIVIALRQEQCQCRVEDSEAHSQGFILKAVAPAEPAGSCGCCVNLFRWQDEVEKIPKYATVPFDEFAVHAGQVNLAQVDGGLGMFEMRGDNGEDAGPLFGRARTGGVFRARGEGRSPRIEVNLRERFVEAGNSISTIKVL